MKIVIPQKVLIGALECGSVAALADEAQNDKSNLSLFIKCVKITVTNDCITFQSTNSLMSSRNSIKVEGEIKVQECGSVLVPAKELISWVDKQKNFMIGISLSKFDTPEIITISNNDQNNRVSARKIGSLKLVSRDSSKTGNKWALDCYDSTQAIATDFVKKESIFNINSDQLIDAIKNTICASLDTHHEHVFDSLVIDMYKDELYLAGSDNHRCSIYKLSKANNILPSFNSKVLIPRTCLSIIYKYSIKNSDVSFFIDNEKNKLIVSQDSLDFKFSLPDVNLVKKFPSIKMLLDPTFIELCKIDKVSLVSRLNSAATVNDKSVKFNFKKASNSLDIRAISDNGLQPSTSSTPVLELSRDFSAVWSVKHIADGIKLIKDDTVCLLVSEKPAVFKIKTETDQNLFYFGKTITNNTKYNNDEV